MKRGELVHHAVVLLLLVGVDGLRMLTKIIETRELLSAVTCKWPLPRMLPTSMRMASQFDDRKDVNRQMEENRKTSAGKRW